MIGDDERFLANSAQNELHNDCWHQRHSCGVDGRPRHADFELMPCRVSLLQCCPCMSCFTQTFVGNISRGFSQAAGGQHTCTRTDGVRDRMLSTSFTTRGGAVASALTRRASRAVFGRGQLGMVDASVLGKLQGAQLFLGSIVLYMWGAQRVQYRMASSSSGGGGSNGAPKKERKKSGVYTRTGDQGTSSLYNGERRSKSDVVFEALGTTDELNAHIGLAKEHCTVKNVLEPLLSQIQSRLMDVGAAIATPQPNSSVEKVMRTRFEDKHVQQLEAWIDEIDSRLPPLKNFILPSGGVCSANLHVARTVCRRAERLVTPLMQQGHVEQAVVQYLNRLSDFLFVAARWAAQCDGKTETIWTKA